MEPHPTEVFLALFSISRLLAALAVILVAWGLLRLPRTATEFLARRFVRYRLQISHILPIARLVVWNGAALVIVVGVFRPPVTTLVTLTASAGLAFGLASQDVLKNILAGIVILVDQPFRTGDMVQVGSTYGEVVNVGLRSVRIHTFDDSTVNLPNSLVLSQAVKNSNSGALDEQVVVEFCLPATADVQRVKVLAWEAAASSPYAFLKKPISVVVEDAFDRTFLTRFQVKCYVLDVRLERVLASDITERIKLALVEQGLLNEATVLGPLAAGQA